MLAQKVLLLLFVIAPLLADDLNFLKGHVEFEHVREMLPTHLKQSALKLLTHERLRRTMGRKARRVARERFSVDEMVDRYIRVYDSLR